MHAKATEASSERETLRKADMVDTKTASSSKRKKHNSTAKTIEVSAQRETSPDKKTAPGSEANKETITVKQGGFQENMRLICLTTSETSNKYKIGIRRKGWKSKGTS